MKDFGEILRYYREKKGFTLRELEKKCGYSYSYLANIEAGRKSPRFYTMSCLLTALGVDVRYVFDGNADAQNS